MIGVLQRRVGRQGGLSLVELTVVMVVVVALTATSVAMYLGYRGRAIERVAQSDLQQAVLSVQAYQTDHGSYDGMDIAALRASDAGLASSIDDVSVTGGGSGYCLGATVDGKSWSVAGPGEGVWSAGDDCARGSVALAASHKG